MLVTVRADSGTVTKESAPARGNAAMSTLHGLKKGAFTGATSEGAGLLRAAHNGMSFLDEFGELGLDEQAMLLREIEGHRFPPLVPASQFRASFS